MNTKNLWIVIGVLALIAVGVYVITKSNTNPSGANTDDSVVCPADVQMCPDGSAVGRIGPDCRFAECPSAGSDVSSGELLPAGIEKPVTGLGVTITPLAVLEDSRCPSDVTCIQAGTVRLSAKVRIDQQGVETMETFSIGVPVSIGGGTVTLVSVSPNKSQNSEITLSSYQFMFQVVGIEFLAEKG